MEVSQPGADSAVALTVQSSALLIPESEPASYRQRGFCARKRMSLTKIGVLLLLAAAWKWGDSSLFRLMAWPGLTFTVAGIAMRIWAAGYLHKHDSLAVSGPYSLIRHPLYFGTGLIVFGQSLLSCVTWLPLVAVGAWFALYWPVMREEEEYLAARYGSLYEEYRDRVPALLPRVSAMPRTEVSAALAIGYSYSWQQVRRNREYEGVIVHLGLLIVYLWLNCV